MNDAYLGTKKKIILDVFTKMTQTLNVLSFTKTDSNIFL